MEYQRLKVAAEDGLAIITLADPATLNAASLEMGQELHHALIRVSEGSSAARAVILTGEGRGFCSGANLSTGAGAVDPDGKPDVGKQLEQTFNPVVTLMRDLPIPFVTAVNGAAAGIGCSFGLMGDIILAAESAYFLQAFRRVGLVPDGGSTYLLPRMIGRARAMEMVLLGEKLPAAKALEWGLINRCVPDAELMPAAIAIAKSLAEGPASLGLIRKAMWTSLDAQWLEQLHHERVGQRAAGKTGDFEEGVNAFMEKRPATFQGR